jgi:hypothetical protein
MTLPLITMATTAMLSRRLSGQAAPRMASSAHGRHNHRLSRCTISSPRST